MMETGNLMRWTKRYISFRPKCDHMYIFSGADIGDLNFAVQVLVGFGMISLIILVIEMGYYKHFGSDFIL